MLEFYHRYWESRNLVKHGATKDESVKIQKELLLERIMIAYDTKDRYFNHPEDVYRHQLFHKKIEKWQDTNISVMQDWLALYD